MRLLTSGFNGEQTKEKITVLFHFNFQNYGPFFEEQLAQRTGVNVIKLLSFSQILSANKLECFSLAMIPTPV
jgi:hypothetical protein